jgi:predicted RNase H-like nuclease (RuvC/YqgF family)
MSSAGHCGRHDIYRCNDCTKNHKDSYHSDLNDLDKRIAELEGENKELMEDNANLHKHASMLESRCDFWNNPMGKEKNEEDS